MSTGSLSWLVVRPRLLGTVLTRNGWSFVALSGTLFALGAVLGYRELIAVALAMALCLVAAVVWMSGLPRLDVRREVVPNRVSEGAAAAGVIRVTNAGRRRCLPMVAVDQLSDGQTEVALPGLTPGASHTTSYPLSTARRGRYVIGPLRISRADPMRLASAMASSGGTETLFVHPLVHRVSPIPSGWSHDAEGPTSSGAPAGGIAFHSLREYEPGDDVRHIHWRSTARTGSVMVRHTVVTSEPRLLLVLDTSASPYDDVSFEDAVRVAASLVTSSAQKRFPTEFRTTAGGRGYVDTAGRGLTDVMDQLAVASRSEDDPGLDKLVALTARRHRGVSLGVVTGQPTQGKANAAGRIRGRFAMVTLIRLGPQPEPVPRLSGVLSVSATTSAEFVGIWKATLG